MKFVVFAVLASLTVVSAGCCKTRCAAPAPACAPMMPPPPPHHMGAPTLEK